jgi:hypothetical protein
LGVTILADRAPSTKTHNTLQDVQIVDVQWFKLVSKASTQRISNGFSSVSTYRNTWSTLTVRLRTDVQIDRVISIMIG